MSKNFNQEYKDLMEQEVPDLWNRIEPSLHEKKSALVETKIDVPTKVIRFPMARIMKYTGVLAACVCIVILIPTIYNVTKNGEQSQDNSQSEMSSDYMSESEEEATEEIMEESTEEVMEEAEAGSLENAVESEEAAISGDDSDEIDGDSKVSEEVPSEETPMELDETVFEGMEIYIIAIKQLPEGVYSYQVEIKNVDHDVFVEGSEIIINAEIQEMKKGRTYTVSMIGTNSSNQEENQYRLKEIIK